MKDYVVSKQLTISTDDFFRLAPLAMEGLNFKIGEAAVYARIGDRQLKITTEKMENRKIGSLNLPQLKIDFRFNGWGKSEREEFMFRFDRVYQRGGG